MKNLGLLFGMVLLVALGCAHIGVNKVDPACNPSGMLRAGTAVYRVMDCYQCEGATACSPHGNDWCCQDSSCVECVAPLVNFGMGHDGGLVDAGVQP